MTKTIEAVAFKLVADSDSSAFVAANGQVKEWLHQQRGFIARELAQMEDGSWLDIVHWASLTDARQAADKIMNDLGGSEFMRMIDETSVKMSHGELRFSL